MRPRLIVATVGLVAISLLAGACDYGQVVRINDLRASKGQPSLPDSPLVDTAAQAHAQAMCTAGVVSSSPAGSYDQETEAAVHELVGAARLDPSIASAGQRDVAATNAIWAQWASDPALVDPMWTDLGIGEATCPDGKLYMTAVLVRAPSMPATGKYSSPQYDASQIHVYSGVQFSSAPDVNGVMQPLLLDIYVPPGAVATPRPTIVNVHGGAFVSGDHTLADPDALQWALRGYVGVSIDYRLTDAAHVDAPNGQIIAAAGATLDAQQSVRWLRANAATYGVDPTRIAMMGNSAGGALTLGAAVTGTATTTGPLAGYSPAIEAAVSTGAFLTPALPLLTLNDHEPGVMMFMYEHDTASNVSAAYAFETCDALRAAGSTCDEIVQAGDGHTTTLTPGGPWWANEIGPFVWNHLDLANAN